MWLLAIAGRKKKKKKEEEDSLMRGRVPHSQLVACVCVVLLGVLDLSVVFVVFFSFL